MTDAIVPDSQYKGFVARLPLPWRHYALLARFDRPIGWWLLFWPCTWGLFLAGATMSWAMVAWLLLGSIAMRGAGCVYNDIVDADLDARVARTAARPIASGAVSKRAAWVWIMVLAGTGLIVLLQLHWQAKIVALGSLVLVHETDHRLAAGVAGAGVHLGRADRVGPGERVRQSAAAGAAVLRLLGMVHGL